VFAQDLTRRVYAVLAGHFDVHQDHVRGDRPHERHDLVACGRLPHQLGLGHRVEQPVHAAELDTVAGPAYTSL
jgi:hypothetical protein